MTREKIVDLSGETGPQFFAICTGKNGKGEHIIPLNIYVSAGDVIECITHKQRLVVQENPKWARLSEDQTSNNENF